MSNFGNTLREIRLSRNMSQLQMAELLGTSKQVVSRYENGLRTPKITVAMEYAKKLGVSLADLNGEADSDESEQTDDIWYLREELRRNPELRILFDAARGATAEDLRKTVAILKTIKGDDPNA